MQSEILRLPADFIYYKNNSMRTDTETLIAAMRILSQDVESNDGVANAAIAEAADRMGELLSLIHI